VKFGKRNLDIKLMRINGFCKTQRKEGRKFNMGVNEIVFKRGP
jgi:hypothetical protein